MRYAICFTPSPSEPLSLAAAAWLGRDAYSGQYTEPPCGVELGVQELSYYTAHPRRFGFHAPLKAPFALRNDVAETKLLRELMCFASNIQTFSLPKLEVGSLGNHYGFYLSQPCSVMHHLAGNVVQTFSQFADHCDLDGAQAQTTDRLSASQLTNLYRWGDPFVMEEYRFQMALTGAVDLSAQPAVDRSMRKLFDPLLAEPLRFANLALFVEEERGAPFRVHSLHPLGQIKSHAVRRKT